MTDPISHLPRGDLFILNNALNEICNGVHLDDWDFETRMGVERHEAKALLARVNEALGKAPSA